jgi:hypothetical protein
MMNSEVGDVGCTRAMRGSAAMTVTAGAGSCSSRPEPPSMITDCGTRAGRAGGAAEFGEGFAGVTCGIGAVPSLGA